MRSYISAPARVGAGLLASSLGLGLGAAEAQPLAVDPAQRGAAESAAAPQPAQRGLTGVVLDAQAQPIAGALVRVFGPNRLQLGQTDTDADGRFTFELPDGTYELRVTVPPYRDRVRLVQLTADSGPVTVAFEAAQIRTEVTVTASRGLLQDDTKVAGTVRSLSLDMLSERAPDLLPRMLGEETGIIAQQTTPGQGSPILRGQSAQAVLYLVDGIRYNNSTYRAGNTQYLAWIPSVAVDALDIQLGPAGVNYGSDALGGAVNVSTVQVPAFAGNRVQWSGKINAFGEAASKGLGGSGTLGVAGSTAAALGAITGVRHQELRSGRGEDSHNVLRRFFELGNEQIQEILGTRLVDTDFEHAGFTGKASWKARDTGTLTGFYMHNEQFNVRRYDRLLGGSGRHRADFTPQVLDFGYARYQDVLGGTTFFESTFSINKQTDGRRDQRFPDSTLRIEENSVTAFGYEALASTSTADHLMSFGGEVYDEYIDSFRNEIRDGVVQKVRPRVPDGSRYTTLGLFFLDDWTAIANRLQVSSGVRFSYFKASTKAGDNIFDGTPTVPPIDDSVGDITFNAGITYQLSDEASMYGRVARGFRAPSLFDLSEQGFTGGGFEVAPAEAVDFDSLVGNSAGTNATSTGILWTSLDPELLWSIEAGFRWRQPGRRFDFAFFDSELTDTISRRTLIVPTDVVGQTIGGEEIIAQDEEGRIFVELDDRPVVSRVNIGRGRVWGIEWLFEQTLNADWLFTLKGGVQRGRELDTGFWARKIAPDNLNAVLRWNQPGGRLWLEGVFTGMLTQNRWNPADLTDARLGAFRDADSIADYFNNGAVELGVVEDGILLATGETLAEVQRRVLGPDLEGNPLFVETPGWFTAALRGGFTFNADHELTFTLANLLDRNYRLHGSGFDAAGLNATFGWRGRFGGR